MTKGTLPNAQIFGNPSYFPIYDYGGVFNQLPLLYQFNPATDDPLNFLIQFPTVSLVPLPAGQAGESTTLTYPVVSNSNPTVATVAVQSPSTLNLQPQAGKTGSATITVRATDSVGNTVDDTFILQVNGSDTYTGWASRTAFPGSQSGISQNPDGNALNNLQEFAFLADPAVPGPGALPAQGKTGSGPEYLTLTFPVRKFTSGLTYVVEANNSLVGSWTTVWTSASGFAYAQVVSFVDQSDRTVVTIKDTAAIGGTAMRFLRTRVVQQ